MCSLEGEMGVLRKLSSTEGILPVLMEGWCPEQKLPGRVQTECKTFDTAPLGIGLKNYSFPECLSPSSLSLHRVGTRPSFTAVNNNCLLFGSDSNPGLSRRWNPGTRSFIKGCPELQEGDTNR